MNVLLIGGGGREHAIAWRLRQSPRLDDLFIAPGNAGTAEVGRNIELPIPKTGAPYSDVEPYLEGLVKAAVDLKVDFVFIGPDDPLSWGAVDRLEAAGVPAFGPTQAAYRLESSKAWAKEFMSRYQIPHSRSAIFDDASAARDYVLSTEGQFVVKADGLSAGKGAIVTSTTEDALQAIDQLMRERVLGDAGSRVVIEERLRGRETGPQAFSDGRTLVPFPLSCDHKAIYDGDQGPNTGGMGVYSPPWWADTQLGHDLTDRVLRPAVDGMKAEGTPFRGILYPNIMVTDAGPRVFEFNARMGDPEAQALMPLLDADLVDIAWAAINGRLDQTSAAWYDRASVCVVLASNGYPLNYETGLPISGLDDLEPDVHAFYAGTRRDDGGTLRTSGGRVLSIVATGASLEEARARAYRNVERVQFEGAHYRRDIGLAS
jgi:phosphoribosylamine---glycine ligase